MSKIRVYRVKKQDNKFSIEIKDKKTKEKQKHYFETRKEARNFKNAAITLDKTPKNQDEIQIANQKEKQGVTKAFSWLFGSLVLFTGLAFSKNANIQKTMDYLFGKPLGFLLSMASMTIPALIMHGSSVSSARKQVASLNTQDKPTTTNNNVENNSTADIVRERTKVNNPFKQFI